MKQALDHKQHQALREHLPPQDGSRAAVATWLADYRSKQLPVKSDTLRNVSPTESGVFHLTGYTDKPSKHQKGERSFPCSSH